MLQASNQMAKMRFTTQVERSNNVASAKQAEIEEYQAEKDRKQEKEDNWRKSSLFNQAGSNLQMHSDIQNIRKQSQLESLKDKINVQTSLQSKRQQDQDYVFKKNLRHEKLMNVTVGNYKLKSEFDVDQSEQKMGQLKQEKEFVDNIVNEQRTENNWMKQNKADIINDLRQNYAMQGHERKEQGEMTIKFL